MADPDREGWGICLAPLHRRLRDPAIASWMADTATTARPRSRRRSVAAADPVGSSPPDQREVLHHRGRGDHTPLGRPLGWAVQTSLLQDAGFQPFVDHPSNDAVRDSLVEEVPQMAVVDRVEVTLDVDIDAPSHAAAHAGAAQSVE